MTLLEECIECLGENCIVLGGMKKQEIIQKMHDKVSFTKWGRINWEKIKEYSSLTLSYLDNSTDLYYIIWDEITLPILCTDMHNIIDNLDDVLAVSFDTWLFSKSMDIIIEIFHDGAIRRVNL